MNRTTSVFANIIFFLHGLLLFLLVFEDRVVLPAGVQVVGRLHLLLLHLPIGILIFSFFLLFVQQQFKSKPFARIFRFTSMVGSFLAVTTALAGFFLAHSGDYDPSQIQVHQYSGIAVSLLAFGMFLIGKYQPYDKPGIRFVSAITFIVLLIAGHSGATLTHGENFIWEPVRKQQPLMAATLYQAAIEPLLSKKCFSCHNESKAKGKLIMTSPDQFRRGGEHGPAFIAGNPDSSRMIQFLHLPRNHDNHMPPEGKPQLAEAEIVLLEAWIRAGADFELLWTALSENDTLRKLSESYFKSTVTSGYSFKEVSAEVIADLNTPFRSVFPIYQGSPAIQVDFFYAGNDADYFAGLKSIREQVVVLNGNKVPLTDADVKQVSQFENLESLNLSHSGITDVGLSSLLSLKKLQSLSLSGNPVSGNAVRELMKTLNLKKIFLWNTALSQQDATTMVAEFPETEIIYSLFSDQSMLTLSKPILVNEGVLKRTDSLRLKHPMPGSVIRFSLDGTDPDSVGSEIFNAPLAVKETVVLKARACREGWYCSPVLESTVFVEGIKPTSVTLITQPDKKYRGEGAGSLVDGRKGFTDVLNEPAWLGYRENPFEAIFDLDAQTVISKVVLSYGNNTGSYLMPPASVEIWGGSSELKLLARQEVQQPATYQTPGLQFVSVTVPPGNYKRVKVIAWPVTKLPPWHSGKGQKGWFFTDEVFFY